MKSILILLYAVLHPIKTFNTFRPSVRKKRNEIICETLTILAKDGEKELFELHTEVSKVVPHTPCVYCFQSIMANLTESGSVTTRVIEMPMIYEIFPGVITFGFAPVFYYKITGGGRRKAQLKEKEVSKNPIGNPAPSPA